jgi:predicted SnoaL-like aldol condensation-catalyzing enzyme
VTAYESETREVLSLKEQIRLVVDTSHAIGSQADGLDKALRGDSQLRGRWGELALERILEAAGLTEGREYILQGRGLGLKSDTGGIQRPDVVVNLPERGTMIIDSKVPLIGYDRLILASDETEREVCGDQFVRDVKGHIEGLAGKRYQENEKLAAHDCVLMFVPIEGALAAALTATPPRSVFWSQNYIQHSAHIPPGREGLFALIKGAPEALHYENGLTVANGDYVLLHGRFSGLGRPANWIVVDIVRLENGQLAEHWDVVQDEVTKEASVSGLPMFGDKFPG